MKPQRNNNKKYNGKFNDHHLLQWVESFMARHELFPKSGRGVVALSGGKDSMLLAHILTQLMKKGTSLKELIFIHVDHHLRSDSTKQARSLKKVMASWGHELIIHDLEEHDDSNTEAWARRERYRLFKSHLKEGDVLFLGHHIDDSFEWYLRSLLNSSQTKLKMGIPLINGPIRRPLHCLTRAQIEKFTSKLKIKSFEDSTNTDLRFQRNRIRAEAKAPLLDIFPKALAHYVHHANRWAQRENPLQLSYKLHESNYGVGVLIKEDEHSWRSYHDIIVAEISRLSLKGRGELRQNLEALYQSLERGDGRRGPLQFSGGVSVFIYPQMLIFANNHGLEKIKAWDSGLSQILDLGTQIPCGLATEKTPFMLYEKSEDKDLKGLKVDPLFGKTLASAQKKGLSLRPVTFLSGPEKRVAKKIKVRAYLTIS